MDTKPKLILMVGLPASGKSTIVQQYQWEHCCIVVCPDDIRMTMFNTEFNKDVEGLVWFTARAMVKMLLAQGHNVVLDSTNLTKDRRKEWIDLAKECQVIVVAHQMDTPFHECLARNNNRDRKVPNDVMARMYNACQDVSHDEGFDQIVNDQELAF